MDEYKNELMIKNRTESLKKKPNIYRLLISST